MCIDVILVLDVENTVCWPLRNTIDGSFFNVHRFRVQRRILKIFERVQQSLAYELQRVDHYVDQKFTVGPFFGMRL